MKTSIAVEHPEWVTFLRPQEYLRFLALVERYFKRRHLAATIDAATGAIYLRDTSIASG